MSDVPQVAGATDGHLLYSGHLAVAQAFCHGWIEVTATEADGSDLFSSPEVHHVMQHIGKERRESIIAQWVEGIARVYRSAPADKTGTTVIIMEGGAEPPQLRGVPVVKYLASVASLCFQRYASHLYLEARTLGACYDSIIDEINLGGPPLNARQRRRAITDVKKTEAVINGPSLIYAYESRREREWHVYDGKIITRRYGRLRDGRHYLDIRPSVILDGPGRPAPFPRAFIQWLGTIDPKAPQRVSLLFRILGYGQKTNEIRVGRLLDSCGWKDADYRHNRAKLQGALDNFTGPDHVLIDYTLRRSAKSGNGKARIAWPQADADTVVQWERNPRYYYAIGTMRKALADACDRIGRVPLNSTERARLDKLQKQAAELRAQAQAEADKRVQESTMPDQEMGQMFADVRAIQARKPKK